MLGFAFYFAKIRTKAIFEENRGRNTFAKAKADAKKGWDDAHIISSERAEKIQAINLNLKNPDEEILRLTEELIK